MTSPRPDQHAFQAPTGTRDFYPAELARLRYIQDAWRRTSINHGFEEIDGPTFEHLELYTVKSGEGIVSELFSFERFGGEKKFALRPEFTPTLARLYAAKASTLPKPTKWFWQQNCFRAERPQRGRLREFCQWNCDIIGASPSIETPTGRAGGEIESDAEIIAACVGCLESLGLTSKDVRIRISDRHAIGDLFEAIQIEHADQIPPLRDLIDQHRKLTPDEQVQAAKKIGIAEPTWRTILDSISNPFWLDSPDVTYRVTRTSSSTYSGTWRWGNAGTDLRRLFQSLDAMGIVDWCQPDLSIVRGLAYYTGMVFEVHEASGAERAIAGGGRYDKLIEMFGGPPTPAVGFGMGDVVLSLVLQDKGLFPGDDQVADRLGLRPDVFVISNGQPEADAQVAPMLARLRRDGLHARRTYKATRNVGKLIGDAVKARARFALIIESAAGGQLKNLETQAQEPVQLADVAARIKR